MNIRFITLATFLVASLALANPQTYQIDASHSQVGFKIKHLLITWVNGNFQEFSGTVTLDDQKISNNQIDVKINPASINTNHEGRDEHLRNADFFDVKKFPQMSYVASGAKINKDKKMVITGKLTMHGVTREVPLTVEELSPEVKDPWGKIRRGAVASAILKRSDFGMTYGSPGVGEEVRITLEIEMSR